MILAFEQFSQVMVIFSRINNMNSVSIYVTKHNNDISLEEVLEFQFWNDQDKESLMLIIILKKGKDPVFIVFACSIVMLCSIIFYSSYLKEHNLRGKCCFFLF